jgi:hypothetical protein
VRLRVVEVGLDAGLEGRVLAGADGGDREGQRGRPVNELGKTLAGRRRSSPSLVSLKENR